MNAAILYAVEAGVATITLNRPDKLNALTPDMLSGFFAAVARAAEDAAAKVIVVTGAGRGFSAGLDLGLIGQGAGATVEPRPGHVPQWGDDVGPALAPYYSGGWPVLITCRKPTIAAINGPAFGWGFILSLHCDIRFAARSALFNATFARIGVPGEKGSAWLLTRLIGQARAMDLLYSARRFDGVEAERLGLVNAVLDDAALMPHVMAYARDIATYSAPRALAAMKAQVWTALDEDYATAFAAADREQDIAVTTADFREAFASYREKRAPDFSGR
ncbi:enoyl-CoA hydratase-related protein [Polymorphobacter fuscus]|uniref:Enoyl-CoA hydratase n=1 Tax=Sandarakinorhabdus fusca TaxID=1439888 RepID=A0A7C9L017_9SPHN|nr:enoyl-CoA hydratase-related protein [Polymorphobacter fuscus]KAB7643705.1 enoyl-CoA hydratase [Polymorphobacter fuscus]MQT18648.1 enoyl-CoA hydratase [Polymorphobacter fuscus]NJC08136.1 enoyl-CoA hydratase/carnithine racemase [Polymorphobacter fuscus]